MCQPKTKFYETESYVPLCEPTIAQGVLYQANLPPSYEDVMASEKAMLSKYVKMCKSHTCCEHSHLNRSNIEQTNNDTTNVNNDDNVRDGNAKDNDAAANPNEVNKKKIEKGYYTFLSKYEIFIFHFFLS